MWDTHCGGLGAGLLAPCRPQGLWHPCPDCLWLTALPPSPPQDSLRCWHFPFYCFEREPRRVEAPLCAWKPCQLSSGGSCPTVPLQALLTQLGGACAECSSRAPGPDARSARCCCWDSWSPCPLPAWPVPLAADWGTGRVRPFCCPPGVEDES